MQQAGFRIFPELGTERIRLCRLNINHTKEHFFLRSYGGL